MGAMGGSRLLRVVSEPGLKASNPRSMTMPQVTMPRSPAENSVVTSSRGDSPRRQLKKPAPPEMPPSQLDLVEPDFDPAQLRSVLEQLLPAERADRSAAKRIRRTRTSSSVISGTDESASLSRRHRD